MELCIKILSDILELLFQENVGPTKSDVTEIMLTVLRTVIQSHINMDRESPYAVNKLVLQKNNIFLKTKTLFTGQFNRSDDRYLPANDRLPLRRIYKTLLNKNRHPRLFNGNPRRF